MTMPIDTTRARSLGKGFQAPLGSIKDLELASRLKNYKRSVASRYRALNGAEIEEYGPPGPLLCSPKIDGELWFLIFEGGECWLSNPGGRTVYGDVPVLIEARKNVGPRVSTAEPRTIIAGELFAIRKGARPRHDDLAAAMGGEASAEVARMGFMAFDLVWGGDTTAVGPFESYGDKLEVLNRLFAGGKRVKVVPTEAIEGRAAVRAQYEKLVDSGKAEGLVLRTADARTVKVKPQFTLDAVVIGYTERADEPGVCRSMALALIREDGQFQVIGSCGNMDLATRKAMFKRFEPLAASASFRHASSSGALYRFIRPEVVIEIKVTDVLADESDGSPILRMVAEYDAIRGYRAVRRMPSVSILHPVFVRVRTDKQPDALDARMAQVIERVMVPELGVHAEPVALPESEVLRREVYTKTTKGALAVRKFVLWATHKQDANAGYPAFVVQFTDYSPGRKDPLKREVRLAPSFEAAEALIEGMVQKNIKRGWKPA
jgi:hypothetical protein